MAIYFYIFVVLTLVSLVDFDRGGRCYRGVNFLLVLVFLSAFSGLRSSVVGADYLNYKSMFYSFDGEGFTGLFTNEYFFEPGFGLLIVLIRAITDNYVNFFMVVSFVCTAFMYSPLKRMSAYPLLSVLIFFSYDFFTNYMVAIRFGVATALGFWVLYLISINKKFFAGIAIFIAMSFHTAAIGLFIPLALSFLTIKRSYILVLIFLSLFIGYFSIGKFVLITIMPEWIPRADSAAHYMGDDMYGNSLGYLSLINIKYIFLSFLLFFYWDRLRVRLEGFNVLVLFVLSAMAIRVGFHDLGFISGRVSALLGVSEIIIVPSIALIIFKQKLVGYFLVLIYAMIHLIFLLFIRGFSDYHTTFLNV